MNTRKSKIAAVKGLFKGIDPEEEIKCEILLDTRDGTGDKIVSGSGKRYTAAEIAQMKQDAAEGKGNRIFVVCK